ncbi:Ig-like domain-containing protein [bacterium]|nr:Ig-like domain-containing protein [bacterium]
MKLKLYITFLIIILFIPACKKKVDDKAPDLHITFKAPSDKEVPLNVDGITVMFDRAMIPLTTLDKGRDQAIDIKISPAIEGKYYWLGTHGFIYRPTTLLTPGTTYKMTIPAGLTAIDGGVLKQDMNWEFTTLTPKIINSTPYNNDTIHPHKSVIELTFNLAMDTQNVESKIVFLDKSTREKFSPDTKLTWLDGDHILQIRFNRDLPWGKDFEINLPAGILAKNSSAGMTTPYTVAYSTPPQTFTIEKVYDTYTQKQLSPGTNNPVETYSQICYKFTQAVEGIDTKNILKIEATDKSEIKNRDYFSGSDSFWVINEKNEKDTIKGFTTYCADFLDLYNKKYTFTLNTHKLKAISGATFEGNEASYTVSTLHAPSTLESGLTKSILSLRGPKQIPYRATNITNIKARIYQLQSNFYSEYIHSYHPRKEYDPNNYQDYIYPYVDNNIANYLNIPLTDNNTIDQDRLPAMISASITPDNSSPDLEFNFKLDLNSPEFSNLPSGYYLIEVNGDPTLGQTHAGSVLSIVQITPVAIALKRDIDHALAWVTDIETGKPVENLPVSLNLIPDGLANITKVVTTNKDGMGIAEGQWATTDTYGTQFCAEIFTEDTKAYSCLTMHELDYNYPLTSSKNYFTYVYTDRPIYRPGQEVNFSAMVRQVYEGYYLTPSAGETFSVSVTDSSGSEIYKQDDVSLAVGGFLSGSFTLDDKDDTPRGNYNISILSTNQTFSRQFVVASYKKPGYKVDITPEKEEIVSLHPLKATVTGEYFFGAALKGAKTRWSIMTTTYNFRPEGYERFNFVDPDLLYANNSTGNMYDYEGEYYGEYDYSYMTKSEAGSFYDDPKGALASRKSSTFFNDANDKKIKNNKVSLDDEGHLTINYTPDLKKYATSQVLTLEANVTDPSNQEVSTATDVVVHKADYYLGLAPQKYVYGENEKASFDIVSINTQGKPTADKSYKFELYERDYQFIERKNGSGFWEYIYEPKDTLIDSDSGSTDGNGNGEATVKISKPGYYWAVVKSTDKKGNTIRSATDVYAYGDGYVPWKMNDRQKLELVPDKAVYKIGDTAKILVKSLVPVSNALVTLERGRLLKAEMRKIGNEGNAGVIEVPITEGMIPNLFINVVAHAGRDKTQTPMLFNGSTEIKVEPEQKKLLVSLIPDKSDASDKTKKPVYRPGDKVTIKVKTTDPAGKPQASSLAVAVVDEAVYKLLDYQLPNLVEKFYYNRPNGVNSASSMISLKAGDGNATGVDKKRRIFKDTAHYVALLQTDQNGEGSFSFTLPDNTTTWVVEALGISHSKTWEDFSKQNVLLSLDDNNRSSTNNLSLSDNTFVGGNRVSILSTLPIVLQTALPRFAAWGDMIKTKVLLNNRNPQDTSGKLLIKLSGDAVFDGESKVKEFPFTVKAENQTTIPFEMSIHHSSEFFTIDVEAQDSKGNILDSMSSTIPVIDRYQPEMVATMGLVTDKEAKEQIDLPKEGVSQEKGFVDISLKSSMGLAISEPMRSLVSFPYYCSEQLSASLIAMLLSKNYTERFGEKYFDSLAPLTPFETRNAKTTADKMAILDNKIRDTLDRLPLYQDSASGGMKYWPSSPYPSDYPSTQVYLAYLMAKNMNYEVKGDVERLKTYLWPVINDKKIGTAFRAFTLWVLVRDGLSDWTVSSLKDEPVEKMDIPTLSYLTLAYADIESKNPSPELSHKLEMLTNRLGTLAEHHPRHVVWEKASEYWSDPVTNTALAANALIHNNKEDPLIAKALSYLFNRKQNHGYITTSALNLILLGESFINTYREDETNYLSKVIFGGDTKMEQKFTTQNITEVAQSKIPLTDITKKTMPVDVSFNKEGTGTLYYDMLMKYYLPPEITPTREEGLVINREYYALDDVKEEHPLSEFKAGENYKGHITVIVPNNLNQVLIEDPLPAGFEPIDMQLATSSRSAQMEAEDVSDTSSVGYSPYDDVEFTDDYGMSYGFVHQEIRDDALIWSDEYLPAGAYHIRYPVRATTAGKYLMSGALAFEFYEPEIFGRSKMKMVEIK